MMVLLCLVFPVAVFVLAAVFYGRHIGRLLGEDNGRETPARAINDGRDYVPTRTSVVFAHHFSTIAGAGPILGPVTALLYGFLPAWIWVIVGGVFIGAVHDFTTLFTSMREGGKSLAEIARKTLGPWGFNLFVLFTLAMLALVTSSFLSATAVSLTSMWPLDKIGVEDGQTFLKTVVVDGVPKGRIGGIASMSVIIITLCSIPLGWLIHKRNLQTIWAYPLAFAICVGSILAGIAFPVSLDSRLWMLILSVYVLFAAGAPVWLILQPRDFINVQILYAGIVLLLTSILAAGFMGAEMNMPALNIAEGTEKLGFIWPIMFITVACGAISGFHSLVAGGTTVKQLRTESDARRIGFNAMLLESLLAVCVLIAMTVGLTFDDYRAIVWPVVEGAKSNPILAFSLAAGNLFHMGLGIPVALGTVFGILLVEGFVVTTLDSAVRLNRLLFEELWRILFKTPPRWLMHYWVNSGISVIIMLALAYSNAFTKLWPIFGAANQMLAALGLLAVAAWLMARGTRYFFVMAPAIFMTVTTLASLAILLFRYVKQSDYTLAASAILLMALSASAIALAIRKFTRKA